MVMGMWIGNIGRGAMVSVPPGEVDRLRGKASHWGSDKMSVSNPVGAMMVALFAA
jgi:hypothetical protein